MGNAKKQVIPYTDLHIGDYFNFVNQPVNDCFLKVAGGFIRIPNVEFLHTQLWHEDPSYSEVIRLSKTHVRKVMV